MNRTDRPTQKNFSRRTERLNEQTDISKVKEKSSLIEVDRLRHCRAGLVSAGVAPLKLTTMTTTAAVNTFCSFALLFWGPSRSIPASSIAGQMRLLRPNSGLDGCSIRSGLSPADFGSLRFVQCVFTRMLPGCQYVGINLRPDAESLDKTCVRNINSINRSSKLLQK